MAEKFTEYITTDGDRWDTIATKAYGNPFDFVRIVDANPNLPIQNVFEAGIRIAVPIIEVQTETLDVNDLPPWKR